MDQDATWYGGTPRPSDIVLDADPSDPAPTPKGAQFPLPQFSAHVYFGQTTGCIKMRLGMEVGLGPGHIMLDGNLALQKRSTAPTPP